MVADTSQRLHVYEMQTDTHRKHTKTKANYANTYKCSYDVKMLQSC